MFISFLFSDIRSWLGIDIPFYTMSVEFPCPDKIDHFTYMTETERPVDWVDLYNEKNNYDVSSLKMSLNQLGIRLVNSDLVSKRPMGSQLGLKI